MKDTKRKFNKDFKLHAIRLVTEGKASVSAVAEQLELAPQTLYRWISEFEQYGEDAFVGTGHLHIESKEIRKLKKRIKDLEEENLILKKANAYFADPKNQY